ncbi:MAG: hypothetical protein FJ041_06390 [Candidatus Cloacimonetes bacterium]|nr:hypothetical protein [Candidatus Cloacimonadota bacterium]
MDKTRERLSGLQIYLKSLQLAAALLLSIIAAEVFVRFVVGYPLFDVAFYIDDLDVTSARSGRIYKPYARLWSVEGGNIIVCKNNLGLPGADITISPSSKYLYLMGTSFLEAVETPHDKIASYYFQKKLQQDYPQYQVLNIAYRNNDPYAQLHRLNYYIKQYPASYGVLVIENVYPDNFWLRRYGKKMSMDIKDNHYQLNKTFKTEIPRVLRNNSSLANLIIRQFGTQANEQTEMNPEKSVQKQAQISYEYSFEVYDKVLLQMQQLLKGNLLVVCIVNDVMLAEKVGSICAAHDIRCTNGSILRRENQLHGSGHLNQKGNAELGQLLYEAVTSYVGIN